MMRSLFLVSLLVLAAPKLLPAGEFEWMTREFARQSGAPQMRIPFLGLARFVVDVAHPAGVSEMKLAIFEHPSLSSQRFSDIADSTIGRTWNPIVRIREKVGDSTNIYAQQDGKHLRLLIASFEKTEVVFVQVRIRPEELMKIVEQQRHRHQA